MPNIIVPTGGQQVVKFDDISKRDLADIVNKQSQELARIERQRQLLCNLLVAIVQEPEALQFDSAPRLVRVDKAAVDRVKQNTDLHLKLRNGFYELTHTPPELKGPKLELPTIQLQ